jgi:hypothetical protein
MAKSKKLSQKHQRWVDARKRFRLSHMQIQMARELGLNPQKLGKMANHDQEPWKLPIGLHIEELYQKHFGRPRPESVRSIEESVKAHRAEKEAKKRRKLAAKGQPEGSDQEGSSMGVLEEVDLALAPIADAVAEFAEQQSFRLDKCPRGNVGWELTRPHALGGTLTLLLLYDSFLGLGIGAVWQFPCPETSLLYSHFREVRPCPLIPGSAIAMLGKELQEIMQVRFGYWTHLTPLETSS